MNDSVALEQLIRNLVAFFQKKDIDLTLKKKNKVMLFRNFLVWITAPEVQIVAKLIPGFNSEKDLLGIRNIFLGYKEKIDFDYLEHLTIQYQVQKDLDTLRHT